MNRFSCLFILMVTVSNIVTSCSTVPAANHRLSSLLSAAEFDTLFPKRNPVYTYAGFLKAAEKFPLFLQEGTPTTQKNELAAFLANIAQETTGGWAAAPGGPLKWGLYFAEEQACIKSNCSQYNSAGRSAYVAAPGKNYYGRGAMQISYLYNYGEAGKDLGLPLIQQPELMSTNATVAFETAIWFWMRAQNNKPSCHDVMCLKWKPSPADLQAKREPGFGMVINVINGGLECGSSAGPEARAKRNGRIAFYRYFCGELRISPDPHCDCTGMAPYVQTENANADAPKKQ